MSAATGHRAGTRWPRTVVLIVLALSALGSVAGLVRADVIALNVAYQGSPARISTSAIRGQDVAIGISEATVRDSAGVDRRIKVIRAGFGVAEMSGLCLSVKQSVLGLGDVVLRLEAGDSDPATYEIKANNIELDLLRARSASASGLNLNGSVKIGMATQDLTTVAGVDDPLEQPMDRNGSGYWGIDATQGTISGLSGLVHDAEIVGSIQLPNLRITTTGSECPLDATVVD